MSQSYSLEDVRSMAAEPGSGGLSSYSLEDVKAMESTSFRDFIRKRETTDLAYGVRRGARDVINTGAELLATGWDKLTGSSEAERVREMNRAEREEATAGRPTTPGSVLGYVGGNVLTTGPVLRGIGAGLSATGVPFLRSLGTAVETGGLATGRAGGGALDMGLRTVGGAANGYVTAGLADSQAATTGAVIGAALPPGLSALNVGVGAAGRAVRNARMPADVRAARDIARISGANVRNLDEVASLRDALRQEGPQIIPGAQTVPEILQTPGVSQLQRSVKAVQPAAIVARDVEREAARRGVLERIAPLGNRNQVAEEVGSSITEYAIPAERAAARRVSELFDAVPSDQAVMQLPLNAMENARSRFLGPGTFGKGNAAVDAAIDEATRIGTRRVAFSTPAEFSSSDVLARGRTGAARPAEVLPQPVPFDQLQKLRSSVSEAINAAERNGQNQSRAALIAIKNAIDNKVAEVASGTRLPGEVFTPQAIDAWGQALQSHAAKKLQFNTGPQAGLFRRGGDGLPLVQGAEIPRRFFNGNASQVADAQSFRRLVQDDARLVADLRRFAVSDAAAQVDRFGTLTSAKFNRWLDARAGATGQIFNDQQRSWLKAIAEDLRRADVAESLGRSTGSDTAQKAASMLNLGFVDSPAARFVAGRVPYGGAALDFLSGGARNAKAERLGGLLLDPQRTGGLLDTYIASQAPSTGGGLLGGAATPFLLRSTPLLLSGGGQ